MTETLTIIQILESIKQQAKLLDDVIGRDFESAVTQFNKLSADKKSVCAIEVKRLCLQLHLLINNDTNPQDNPTPQTFESLTDIQYALLKVRGEWTFASTADSLNTSAIADSNNTVQYPEEPLQRKKKDAQTNLAQFIQQLDETIRIHLEETSTK